MNHSRVLETPSVGYVRILHTVPDAPGLDVYAGDQLLASDLAFSQHTDYLPLTGGTYSFSLYLSGQTGEPLLSNQLDIHPGDIFTICICGMMESISFLAIWDFNPVPHTVNALLRFVHLSTDTPALDVTLLHSVLLFSSVSYYQVTSYLPISPVSHVLQLRLDSNPSVPVLTIPTFSFQQGRVYTLYAIGLFTGEPPLQGIILEDSTLLPPQQKAVEPKRPPALL